MMGSCDVLVKGCNSLPLCPIPLRDEDLYIDGHISTISTKRELPFIAVVWTKGRDNCPPKTLMACVRVSAKPTTGVVT